MRCSALKSTQLMQQDYICSIFLKLTNMPANLSTQTTVFKLFCATLFLISSQILNAQTDGFPYAQLITTQNTHSFLEVLTSDSLEGRETGKIGNERAANFIANHVSKMNARAIGDSGTYFQRIVFTNDSWNKLSASLNGKPLRNMVDFLAYTQANPEAENIINADSVMFLGYGIETPKFNDYRGNNLKGKVVLILTGEPFSKDSVNITTGKVGATVWSKDRAMKVRIACAHGARAIIFLNKNFSRDARTDKGLFTNSSMNDVTPTQFLIPNIYLSTTATDSILQKYSKKIENYTKQAAQGKSAAKFEMPFKISFTTSRLLTQIISRNVLGFFEGSDSVLKKEVVVVSCHLDHLGKRGNVIYHGADDNGSGSSGLMAMCEAFGAAEREHKMPKRSILCLFMTGEEKGLLGSKYYVNHPKIPIDKTVADINIDMIGRIDPQHRDTADYVYVIGADKLSDDMERIHKEVNARYTKLHLDYTYNDENDPNRYYYRSDHYNFAEKGIPVVFLFNGTHADYHQPTDTIDKINFEALVKRAQFAFLTAWEIADRKERLKVRGK